MLSFGRDEDGELTGCGFAAGFCTDISLPASDPVRSFTRRSPSASPPVLPLEPIQTGFSSVLDAAFPLSGGRFCKLRTGRAALQQETQQPGSGGPRTATVERSHV